jgi:hypothetical protein
MSNTDFIPHKGEDFSRWFLRKLKHTVNQVPQGRHLINRAFQCAEKRIINYKQ